MSDPKTRIVLIDDHVLVREGLAALLRQSGIEVVAQGRSGEEAVDLAQRLSPDVVVMDVSLEGLNGIEAAKRIVAAGTPTGIVMISMHRSTDVLNRAFGAGARGYVLKGGDVEDLLQAIRTVLRGESFITREMRTAVAARTAPLDREGEVLTARENEILRLVAEGLSSKEIAAQLGLSPKTVINHRANIMQKLNISSTVGLVRYFLSKGD